MANTETEWTKEFPSLKDGNWFWLRNTTPNELPRLAQLCGGYNFYEPLGIVSPTTEYLGPVTATDAEQLVQLRRAALTLLENNGGPTSTLEGTDTHVLIRREDFEALVTLVDPALNPSHSQEEKPTDLLEQKQ